ncbi:MAG: DUF1292 domain-containing protein [Clostridia bacterium]|nr:DUF1292 domain-containing protein [Clostridia bacterium]
MSKKNYITLTDENGVDTLYELIDEVNVDGNSYVAIVPVCTEYYVLKKVNPGKKNESFVSVEGKELERLEGVFQSRLGAIDYDN